MAEVTTTVPPCKCKRPIEPLHCPVCGSLNHYGKKAAQKWLPIPAELQEKVGSNKVLSKGHHCRKCNEDFHELMPCEAPTFLTRNMRERRALDQASETLERMSAEFGGDRQAMIEALFKKGAKE